MEANEIDKELVEELKQSKQKFGALSPVILDANGRVVEGHHRKHADPNWPSITYEEIKTEEDRVLYAIAFNWHRREKTEAWKSRMLSWLAKQGYDVDQIAEKTGLSKRTIYRYLPSELKGPEPEELHRARLAREKAEVQMVPCACARCHVSTSAPVHVKGKLYCESCAQKIEFEMKGQSHIPITFKAPGGEPGKTAEEEPESSRPRTPQPETVDFVEVTCPVCKETFRCLVHHGQHDHRVEYYREAEET